MVEQRMGKWMWLNVIIIIGVFGVSTSCVTSSCSEVFLKTSSNQSQLSTPSIYGTFTIQEIVDSLYSDTLRMRDYFDSSKADTFYQKRIEQLVKKIQEDGNDSLSLFPECSFDRVVAKDANITYASRQFFTTYGLGKDLNLSQIETLMRVINNPLHFSWGECGTWTPSSKFEFYYQGNLVRTLNVGCGWQFKTDFQKIKFGTLADVGEFHKLCKELNLKNEPVVF